jgi:uncharacterized protein (TIGR03437 family)
VQYSGGAPGEPGEDQINVQIPNVAAFKGQLVNLTVVVNGQSANVVQLNIGN